MVETRKEENIQWSKKETFCPETGPGFPPNNKNIKLYAKLRP